MPKAIDEEALAKKQNLDIADPPLKDIPYYEFPKMVYRHPKDKTLEHRTRIVADQDELDKALKEGWKKKPHIPIAPPDPSEKDFEEAKA